MADVAAELAADALDGRGRAAALAHLARCQACRREVAEMSDALDSLLSSAPPAEPPAGFEQRVLVALGRSARRRSPSPSLRHIVAAAVVAAVVLAAALVPVALVFTRSGGGTTMRVAALRVPDGRVVGQALAYTGAAPRLVVDVRSLHGTGDYTVNVATRSGSAWMAPGGYTVGIMRLVDGAGTGGFVLPYPPGDLSSVWLADSDRSVECAGRFDRGR